jgi:transposase
MTDRAISPNELARKLGVKHSKVLGWINRGELRAINLAERSSGRPRWKILPDALNEFFLSRQSSPPPAPRRARRKFATKEYF